MGHYTQDRVDAYTSSYQEEVHVSLGTWVEEDVSAYSDMDLTAFFTLWMNIMQFSKN